MSDRISEEFWKRKSQEWESELQATEVERTRLEVTFDRGSLVPTYRKPFDPFAHATELENGGVDGTRTRGLRRDRPAF